jgi:hypothetical protein
LKFMPVPRERLCRIAHISTDISTVFWLSGAEGAPAFSNQSSIVSDDAGVCTIEHQLMGLTFERTWHLTR